jgi:alanine racemase
MSRATTATIHIEALRHNLSQIRALAPHSKVMAVVKADGYGHGLERVARALEGADAFGVAALSDAERLRAVGLSQRIVLLSGIDDATDLSAIRRLGVDTVLHHDSQLALLQQDTEFNSDPIRVWLKLDTGMHRLGFPVERAETIYTQLKMMPNVHDDITLMTHFASSDEFDSQQTTSQLNIFDQTCRHLSGLHSLSNSAAILGWPSAHQDWVRAGGALYGLSVVEGKTGADFGLKPAMSLSTKLIAINYIKKGERIGYSATWQCPEDMPVGVAAIGYGDGYPRHASAGTPVLINGVRVPIIGRVSMDLMTLDLRGIPDAKVGDDVLLWGTDLPVEIIAKAAGTISYELTCSITRRVRFIEA